MSAPRKPASRLAARSLSITAAEPTRGLPALSVTGIPPSSTVAVQSAPLSPHVQVSGVDCLLSRTGYTGEDGFEIYMPPEAACTIWEAILQEGGDRVAPCGLGARDTLRLEAKMPLYGHEMDEDITPLEAGFGRFVKLEKPSFIGKEALAEQKEKGLERKLVEFEMLGRGIPRPGYDVQKDGTKIGHVTSGGYLPTLEKNLGLCLIKSEFALIDNEIEIMIRKKAVKARTGKGLFYRRGKK
jgi:aminomethyltransferase